MSIKSRNAMRIPPEVNRILFIKNLPYKIQPKDLYEIFGKFGSIRQIRKGNNPDTRGTAFVIYDDIFDAKNAVDNLNGFQVSGRYLIVLYFKNEKAEAQPGHAQSGASRFFK